MNFLYFSEKNLFPTHNFNYKLFLFISTINSLTSLEYFHIKPKSILLHNFHNMFYEILIFYSDSFNLKKEQLLKPSSPVQLSRIGNDHCSANLIRKSLPLDLKIRWKRCPSKVGDFSLLFLFLKRRLIFYVN